jgi:hypothetical protein
VSYIGIIAIAVRAVRQGFKFGAQQMEAKVFKARVQSDSENESTTVVVVVLLLSTLCYGYY